ncbi:hypothetical protein COOONC_24561 [Cooperia oncophora]
MAEFQLIGEFQSNKQIGRLVAPDKDISRSTSSSVDELFPREHVTTHEAECNSLDTDMRYDGLGKSKEREEFPYRLRYDQDYGSEGSSMLQRREIQLGPEQKLRGFITILFSDVLQKHPNGEILGNGPSMSDVAARVLSALPPIYLRDDHHEKYDTLAVRLLADSIKNSDSVHGSTSEVSFLQLRPWF